MKVLRISEYSKTPGVRSTIEGPYSGEDFRKEILEPEIRNALKTGEKVQVILDGTLGYATSFLEEVFGGIVRTFGHATITKMLQIVSNQRPFYIEDIKEYMEDAKNKRFS